MGILDGLYVRAGGGGDAMLNFGVRVSFRSTTKKVGVTVVSTTCHKNLDNAI